jgi:dephospho-CoA kinase
VTGGIGSGKTTAARLFGEWGAVVLEMDAVAKSMIAAGGPLVDAVAAEFGDAVKGAGGGIDPAALARLAFESPECAARLNAVVHPGVIAASAGALDLLAAQETPPEVVVVDIPLLVEAPGFFALVDSVLAISSDEDTRVDRLMARGMPEDDALARIACQATDHERRDVADWVIHNDGTLEEYLHELQRFWEAEVLPRVS